jgi:ubiquinone/menaquinone biosynthesis C-methylase UbiE
MDHTRLPPKDDNGIVRALPRNLSETNRMRIGKFAAFMSLYDFFQNRWVRPRIHKANPDRHWQIMHEIIAPVRQSAVLDLACGTGSAIAHFDSSNDYTGLDLSYAMLKQAMKRARTKGFRSHTLIEGNAEELPLADESFDFVLIDTSLHMIPEYRKCIAETARVLKKGGELICSTPTVGIDAGFDAKWARIAPKRRLHSLRESDYQAACSGSGFAYERLDINGGVLYFRAHKRRLPNADSAEVRDASRIPG